MFCWAQLLSRKKKTINASMDVGINKRKGRGAVGMLSSGHGSATLSVRLSLYPRRPELESLFFSCRPCMCVCSCLCASAVHWMHIHAHMQMFVNPPWPLVWIYCVCTCRSSIHLIVSHSSLRSSLPPTWNLYSFVLSHFSKICNPVAKTACHLHDNTLLIHKSLVG